MMVTPFGHQLIAWQQLIVLVSIASMILGALAAIGQTNIKRLMAYSSIGHMGYALIGLAVGTPEGVRGVLIYMIVYVFMSAGTFACIIAMQRRGRSLEQITDLNGLGAHRSGAGAGDGGVHVQHGRHPAAVRLLRQALRLPCRGAGRHVDAGRHRRADQRGGRVLLPADRQGDVFRRAGGAVRSAPGLAVLRRRGDGAVHHVLLHFSRRPSLGRPRRQRRCCSDEGIRRPLMPGSACSHEPCSSSSTAATPTSCSPCTTATRGAAPGASAPSAQRTSDEYGVWLLTLLGHAGLKRDDISARGDRHRGAGRAVSPAPALPRLVQYRAAGRALHARLGLRYPGRQSGRGRRGPAAERARRRTSVSAVR